MSRPLLSLASYTARLLPSRLRSLLYRLGPLTHWIRQALNRSAPGGLTEVTIAAGKLRGFRFLLDLQTEKDYWLGTYEPHLQEAVSHWVKPGHTVYDVGANVGYLTLLLAHQTGPQGAVFAFEALPANVERLKDNLQLNALPAPVKIIHTAVIDQPAPVNFLVHASPGMGKAAGSAGRKGHYLDSIRVPGTSLDHFVYELGNPPPHLIKMDIEGGEVLALQGMRTLLVDARPRLFLELHGAAAAQFAWNTLTPAGYALHRMQNGYPLIPNPNDLQPKDYLVATPLPHRPAS